jgi:O-antigen/teichoic acid export membrane protein
MTTRLRERIAALAALSTANALALVGGLAATMAVLRLLDRAEFAAWAVALSLQALVCTGPLAAGPGCARWLSDDPSAADSCRSFRLRAAWAAAGILFASGSIGWMVSPGAVTPVAWLLLSLQIPALALEAHRIQTLQMSGSFQLQALQLPLSRLAKAGALWILPATGHGGIELVALLQLGAQILVVVPWLGRRAAPVRVPDRGFVRLWRANLASGLVVWSGTRSTILVLDARSSPHGTATYGVADTLCSSLQLPLQALGSLLQPAIYSWSPGRSVAPLWKAAVASIGMGAGLCLIAFLAGPDLLRLLAGEAGSESAASLAILGWGILAAGVALVPGTLLQRLGAGATIATLETAAAATGVLGLLLLPAPGPEEAALCWTAGRWIWAAGSAIAAIHRTRRASGT